MEPVEIPTYLAAAPLRIVTVTNCPSRTAVREICWHAAVSAGRGWSGVPVPPAEHDASPSDQTADDAGSEDVVAEVIPLRVFDARKEAQSWRL